MISVGFSQSKCESHLVRSPNENDKIELRHRKLNSNQLFKMLIGPSIPLNIVHIHNF